jgi:hypothetical protein
MYKTFKLNESKGNTGNCKKKLFAMTPTLGPTQPPVHGYQVFPGDGGLGGPIPPKFRSFDKAEPISQFRGKYVHP